MKQVTIIIPNYNGKEYLEKCLNSVFGKTTVPVEVIVVDNHSKDRSLERMQALYPQAAFIRLNKNYGFSRAVNEGVQRAKTQYVLLLNNDTEIEIGFVEALLQRIRSDEKIFSVEAKMLQLHDRKKIDSAGTFYNALGWARARGKDKNANQYAKSCETFAACAGAAIYRKSLVEKLGYFDESFFAYLEDIDIGYRARIAGYRNYYEPQAVVYHVGSGTSGSRYNSFKVRISARNNLYLIYKNMPLGQIVLNSPLLLAGFGIKAGFFLCKGYGKEYLQGFKDGIQMCRENEKLPFKLRNLRHYINIQKHLWKVKI